MRSSSLTASTAIMILLLTACGGEPEPPAATTPTDSTTEAPATTAAPEAATDPAAQKPPEAPPGADFKTPMVPGNDPTAIGNLLQPTSPEQRLAQIEREKGQNRSNPFGAPGLKPPPVEQMQLSQPEQLEQAVKNLQPRSVPDLPELPLLALAPPPGATPPLQRPLGVPGGNGNATNPATNQRQAQGGGNGRGVSPPAGNGRGVSPPGGNGRGVTPPGGNGRGVSPTGGNRPVASRPANPRTAALPQLQARGVPDLPELPTPIGPKLPPAPKGEPIAQIPASAQTPRVVPELPELPTPIGPAQLPPPPVAQVPQAPPPPPPPDTKLADATEVTGVIQVGNQIQIIAKAPNEPSSRYIKVGQKIANGEVTVKRVEKEDGEPIVILEQNGVEVRKTIGQAVAIATDEKK